MRVVHISTLHRALDVRILRKECRSLAEAGHEVVLLAKESPGAHSDGVRIDGPRIDGVRIESMDLPRTGPRPLRIAGRLREALRRARSLSADVYHFHDPELIPVGLALRRGGARVVYDVHEDTPREARTVLVGSPLRRSLYPFAWRALEAAAKARLDAFVCATPDIAARFPDARTVTVCNFPRLDEFEPTGTAPPTDAPALRRPLVVYAGGLTASRGLFEMVHAMALLPQELGARLQLLGELSSELGSELARTPGFERVDVLGWQGREGVLSALHAARVGLVLLHPTPEYQVSYPVKLFEYMAAGLPVVASDFPLWRSIVAGADCGRLVDPRDPAAIAGAIGWLLEHPAEARALGQRGREAVRARYQWESEARKLVALYARFETEQTR